MRAGPQLRVFYPSWRKRQPYGSAMGLQAAPLRSPFKVVADASILTTSNHYPQFLSFFSHRLDLYITKLYET